MNKKIQEFLDKFKRPKPREILTVVSKEPKSAPPAVFGIRVDVGGDYAWLRDRRDGDIVWSFFKQELEQHCATCYNYEVAELPAEAIAVIPKAAEAVLRYWELRKKI